MTAQLETLEGNKVRLTVSVDDADWDKAVDAAYKRIAGQVRLPGFRPGKAPRKLLEQRLGPGAAREEALRTSLGDFYSEAVKEAALDPIAPPDIEITSGREDGPLVFDAVVEVRPVVSIAGYQGLQVEVPTLEVDEEAIEAQLNRFRSGFAELVPTERAAADGDNVVIDIKTSTDGEEVEQMSQDDYTYEVGAGIILDELDENLRGAKIGETVSFDATAANGAGLHLDVTVKEVKEKVLPELTDEWVNDNSEFSSVDELTEDVRTRLGTLGKLQAQAAVREGALKSLAELVVEDIPEAMISAEADRALRELAQRVAYQGGTLSAWLEATGKSETELMDEVREGAVVTAKTDLALRALADAEGIEASDDEVGDHLNQMAEQMGQKGPALRRQLEKAGQMEVVVVDVRKKKAYDWLVDNIELVDAQTRKPVDRAALEVNSGEDGEEPDDGSENEPAMSAKGGKS